MLTALGATLTVLLSLQLDQMLHGPWRALAESIGATQDVSRFGADTLNVLEYEPEKLTAIKASAFPGRRPCRPISAVRRACAA